MDFNIKANKCKLNKDLIGGSKSIDIYSVLR